MLGCDSSAQPAVLQYPLWCEHACGFKPKNTEPGWDTHSFLPVIGDHEIINGALAKGMFSFSVHDMYFEARDDDPLIQLLCPPVEGMDYDFFGNPVTGDQVLPGPFQAYHDGHNRFVLRPPVVEP